MRSRQWLPWLSVAAVTGVYAAGSTPWIAQRLPRFAVPALAAVGGLLALAALGRALARSVRRFGSERRVPVLSLLLTALVVVVIVVLPLMRAASLLTPPPGGAPRVLTGFGSWRGSEGYPLLRPHRGIDVAGDVGADVLAAADGRVTAVHDSEGLCGLLVAIAHEPHGYRTVYCHFSEIAVQRGESVARGQRIGALGTTGQRAWPGYEHVHLELQRGSDPRALEDPLSRTAGCFEPSRTYPSDRLVLTYPVRC